MTSPCRISANWGFSGSLFHVFLYKMRYLVVNRKRIHYSCEDGVENLSLTITACHHSASLVMPIGDPWDDFFLSLPHTYDRFLYYRKTVYLWDFLEAFVMFFPYKILYLVVRRKNNPLFVWGWDRIIRPSRSMFVITRQAIWCQSVILGTGFSIPPSHSW